MSSIAAGRYLCLTVFVAAAAFGQPQSLIIPHVADGGGWQTTLVLANTVATTGSASFTFHQETTGGATQNWNLAFSEASTQNVSLTGGATVFLHTLGTSAVTSVGWAQIIVSPGIVAYAIFTQRIPGHTDQDGTAASASVTERYLVPFDNTSGCVSSVAIVNPSSVNATVTINIEVEGGAISQSSFSIPGQGHMAFALTDQFPATAGRRGLIEFYGGVRSGTFGVISLRFNSTGGFTTAPAYALAGAPIIGVTPPSPGTR